MMQINRNVINFSVPRPQSFTKYQVARKVNFRNRAEPNEEPFVDALSGGSKAKEQQYTKIAETAKDEATKQQAMQQAQQASQTNKLAEATFDTFKFAGVPESVNGRMCMLAFVWGVGKEIITGETLPQQFKTTPALVWFFFFSFIAGSIIVSIKGAQRKDYEFGPFTETAEVYNGRTAMLGFVSLNIIELVTQTPLFATVAASQGI